MDTFWNKVNKTETCWLWTGAKTIKGYGIVSRKGRLAKVHRVAYALIKGEIPEGLVIDHLCRVRLCVNPDHLEAVTTQENTKRSLKSTKTHCIRGHKLIGNNLITRKDGSRRCRACNNERQREWKRKISS